ncbi:MAG: peptide MFS transporter [Lachnospiraceae bacterium]
MDTQTKKKLPAGFWACSCTEIFERFAYYLGRSILLVFVATGVAQGGLGLSDGVAANMQSNLTAFSYGLPILCSIVCDRLIGARYTTPVGMAICGVGYWLGSLATNSTMMYAMIWCISIGLAFYKTGPLLGRIVDKDQLNQAYSIRYSLVNIGAFAGPFLVGIMYQDIFAEGDVLGFRPCFKVAAVLMWLGAIWFAVGSRFMGDAGKKPFKKEQTAEELAHEAEVKAQKQEAKNIPYTAVEKKRVGAIILVCFFAIIFWILWYLAYLPVYYHWGENANWVVAGYNVPLTWFDAANALFCVLVGMFITPRLWTYLANRPKGDLSIYKKCALGIGTLGISYLYFGFLDIVRGDGQISCLWMLIFALLITLGEMFFSPLGNAFIAEYAPSRIYSVMQSVWGLAIFFAAKGYGYLYNGLFGGKLSFVTGCIIAAVIAAVGVVLLIILDKPLSNLVKDKSEK